MRDFNFNGHFTSGNNPDKFHKIVIGTMFHGVLSYDDATKLWSIAFTIETQEFSPSPRIVNNNISPEINADKYRTDFFGDFGDWEMDYTLEFSIVPREHLGIFKINVYDPDIAPDTHFQGPIVRIYE